jgi:hypothetical protein
VPTTGSVDLDSQDLRGRAIEFSVWKSLGDLPHVCSLQFDHEVDIMGQSRFPVDDTRHRSGDHVGDTDPVQGSDEHLDKVRFWHEA